MFTEHAFGEFYQRHSRAVWTYVYRVTNDAADADDIVQEAFLRLFQADTAPSDDEGLRRYLFRIAGNLIADRWRRRARDASQATPATVESDVPMRDLDVARLFSELKPRERALLWLAYVEGDTHRDIADSLRLARGSVKVLLSRARARLRDLLTARGVHRGTGKMTDRRTGSVAIDERVIAAFMDKLRTSPLEMTPRMPGADVLWVKARLIRQWEAQRKVRRPIEVMEPVELAVGLMAAGLLLAWSVPSAFEWIPRLIL